jgi:hypothetical protein
MVGILFFEMPWNFIFLRYLLSIMGKNLTQVFMLDKCLCQGLYWNWTLAQLRFHTGPYFGKACGIGF